MCRSDPQCLHLSASMLRHRSRLDGGHSLQPRRGLLPAGQNGSAAIAPQELSINLEAWPQAEFLRWFTDEVTASKSATSDFTLAARL